MIIVDNRTDYDISEATLKKAETYIDKALAHEGVSAPVEISLSLVEPAEIQELNARYRNKDNVTDVLSFPMLEFPADEALLTAAAKFPVLLGDIVLCVERAGEQAGEYGHDLEREVCYLCVHSVLHLLGYDHLEAADKEAMRRAEKEIMGDD